MKKYMHKVRGKRAFAAMMAAALFMSCQMPAWAATQEISKDENVYVNLAQDGSVEGVYVVNAWQLEEETDLVDYGAYSSIRNLTSEDEIMQDGSEVTVHAPAGKFFYQGNLEKSELPWKLEISYALNQKECSAQELAGKSGELEIRIRVNENPKAPEGFFEHYLLQATVVMDMERCSNLQAEGAIMANVGTDKQLLYNIMAGQEKEILICADVTDFEMDAITFQGVPMSFDLNKDSLNMDALYEKTDKVKTAATDLDDGALKLTDGAVQLDDGVTKLTDGAGSLDDGAASLSDGAMEMYDATVRMQDGIQALQDGTNQLGDGVGSVKAGAGEIKSGAGSLTDGIGTLKEKMKDAESGADLLVSGSSSLYGKLGIAKQGADKLAAGYAGDNSTDNPGYVQILKQVKSGIASQINQQSLEEKNRISGALGTYASILEEELQPVTRLTEAEKEEGFVSGNIPSAESASTEYSQGYAAGIGYALTQLQLMQTQIEEGEETDMDAALTKALSPLEDYMKQLYGGTMELQSGLGDLQEGAKGLVAGSSALQKGTVSAAEGSEKLYAGAKELYDGSDRLYTGTEELENGAEQLKGGTSALQDGGTQLVSGGKDLYDGTVELRDGTTELKDGAEELKDGSTRLIDGTKELEDGTSQFKTETEDIDDRVDEEIDRMISEFSGDEYEPVSFVSDRNANVKLVQFVMTTSPIEAQKEETEQVVQKEETIWDRVKNLFE